MLYTLKGAHYEPLQFAIALTWKALFLVSVAACRLISEIRGYLYNLVVFNTDGSVTLRSNLIFTAKNRAPGKAFPPTVIHRMLCTLLPDNSDRVLGPFRPFKYHLKRTKHRRNGNHEATRNGLSRWIAATIKFVEMAGSHVL